jgi:DNA-binding response OmpR family regulator
MGRDALNHVSDERHDPPAPARVPLHRKGRLLFVDPDDFLIDMMICGLALSRPKWETLTARKPSEAFAVLAHDSELDAIITEIVFDHSSDAGKSFIHEVGQRWPEIPIFVMTNLDPQETRGLDTAEFIAKPPDIDFLVSRVDRAIRRQTESLVRGISLPTFLQILEIEQKTCTLVVSHGGEVGEVFFREGRLIQARLDGLEGEEALFRLLSMREHSLRVLDRCDTVRCDAARGITSALASLLMEWSVRQDHARSRPRRDEEQLSSEEDE